MGGEVWWLGAPFGSATTKDIGKKRTMIGRDFGFFAVVDSVSSLGNGWNRGGVLGSRWKGDERTRRVTQFHDQPDPEHWKIARSQAAIMSYASSRFSDRCWLVFKNLVWAWGGVFPPEWDDDDDVFIKHPGLPYGYVMRLQNKSPIAVTGWSV